MESDRRQVEAPSQDRIAAFVYEKFLSRVIDYVHAGNRGGALDRAVFEASDRMKASYASAAKGMHVFLRRVNPVDAIRRQRSVVVTDRDGYQLVSLRVHLIFRASPQDVGAFIYFAEKGLSAAEVGLMETAIAMAVQQVDPSLQPMLVFARTGAAVAIDEAAALSPSRVAFLRAESLAYREAWAVAA